MATDTDNDPLFRLQALQHDLIAATEARLANLHRLAAELDASADDLRRLLAKNKKNDTSREKLKEDTIEVDQASYHITDPFRQSAIQVADELDLDEIEAASLCIRSQLPEDDAQSGNGLSMRAVLRFHNERLTLLECFRLLLQLADGDLDTAASYKEVSDQLVKGERGDQAGSSAFWRKCTDGLSEVQRFLAGVVALRNKFMVAGQGMSAEETEWVSSQRLLLTRQHESLATIMSSLLRQGYVLPEDFRGFLSNAAGLDASADITAHYLPIIFSGTSKFAADSNDNETKDLDTTFTQLQWRQIHLKAAAKVSWLAEYSGRLAGHGSISQGQGEEARAKAFLEALKDGAFSFILASVSFLKPVVWHDPARTAIVDFLIGSAITMPADAPRATEEFAALAMTEMQQFGDAFITNMHDVLRQLKFDEDEQRRNLLSQSAQAGLHTELELERFIVILACAYQDDADAAKDIWTQREGHFYGFLRWVSQRLPTPRVAAFCLLLRSIACDDNSANSAHRFLLEDVAMTSGRLRKAYSVSWSQIFSELEIYASLLKDRPAAPQHTLGQDRAQGEMLLEEPETGIMLDAYLGLAAHICRKSSDARNWLLKEQSFHLGEVMFALARSATESRIRACCLDVLSALLTENVLEVRNGMWVLLDSWISSGGLDGSSASRNGRAAFSAKHYLQYYANSAEAGASLIALLNALIAPTATSPDHTIDELPFPENLGAPHRHAGIDAYVDFVLDAVFARKVGRMLGEGDSSLVDIIRYECLHFAFQCLSTFNEDLVQLANTTTINVESTMETKSLTAYARLHPFARVMEWLFDKNVLMQLFLTLQQNFDQLDNAESGSPLVKATLRSIQILNLAWQLQPTYFDLVRPAIISAKSKSPPVSSTWSSIDEIFLTHLNAVVDIADYTASCHVEISLECIQLLRRLGSSRKLTDTTDPGAGRHGSRIVGVLAPISTALTLQLSSDFVLQAWDFESDEVPLKVLKANAVLDLLNDSLDTSSRKPGIAHCLLGFHCRERDVEILPLSAYSEGRSLFNAIAKCAADADLVTIHAGNTSWLMALKRRCLEVILKLAVAPMTSRLVQPDLRAMDFLPALSQKLSTAPATQRWDGLALHDTEMLLQSSATAVRDYLNIRASFFRFAAMDLRAAAELNAYSVQEKTVATLLGTIMLPDGEQVGTTSVFDLFDFFDLETADALIVPFAKFFDDLDVSVFTKDDPETGRSFDIDVAEKALVLRKRELKDKAVLRDSVDLEQAENETHAILAALTSQNNYTAIQIARSVALEAWTDLLSLMVNKGALRHDTVVAFSLQGLGLVLSKYEKTLSEDMDSAALLAKLVLTFTHAISAVPQDGSDQTANAAVERLLWAFRVSLKAITDSSTSLALRDVAFRTSCAIMACLTTTPSRTSLDTSSKKLLHLLQNSGERLLAVVTEDAFSGRGITRVSALLFLDSLVVLFQRLRVITSMLRSFTKLNFVPVLLDTSIGNVASAFQSEEEMVATLAYFHTSLTLLLRLCQTADGTQLVLNSGLFQSVEDSKLFHTDVDLGLDIENPKALKEFYSILANVLRLITAVAVQKSAQQAKAFLQQHRFTVQAIFKQASRGQALDVAEELSRLILATDFLEEDQAVAGVARTNGFT